MARVPRRRRRAHGSGTQGGVGAGAHVRANSRRHGDEGVCHVRARAGRLPRSRGWRGAGRCFSGCRAIGRLGAGRRPRGERRRRVPRARAGRQRGRRPHAPARVEHHLPRVPPDHDADRGRREAGHDAPELARVGTELAFFDPGDGSYIVRSSADHAGVAFTTQPLLWSPEPGQQVLVVAARGKAASFVAAWWVLPDGGYRLASTFVMMGEIAPVALAYRPAERDALLDELLALPGRDGARQRARGPSHRHRAGLRAGPASVEVEGDRLARVAALLQPPVDDLEHRLRGARPRASPRGRAAAARPGDSSPKTARSLASSSARSMPTKRREKRTMRRGSASWRGERLGGRRIRRTRRRCRRRAASRSRCPARRCRRSTGPSCP